MVDRLGRAFSSPASYHGTSVRSQLNARVASARPTEDTCSLGRNPRAGQNYAPVSIGGNFPA
jgi:hypothetical protein